MPVQTRAQGPANRVYSSPATQQQVRFKPRKRNVTSRRSLGASRTSRQRTLTQIDFVNLQEVMSQDDIDENGSYEEEEHTRKRKRRRTEGDAPSSSSKFHTQTLTQLEFVSTLDLNLDDIDDMTNDFRNAANELKQETYASPTGIMGPPKTPIRRRVYEVPSSQSPLSPASVRSEHHLPIRSPLKALDVNFQLKSFSPSMRQGIGNSPEVKSEIQDTYEDGNESQQSRVPQTPKHNSNLIESPNNTTGPRLMIKPQKQFKDEIRDSDEEDSDEEDSDQDLDTYLNDRVEESQPNHYTPEPSSQIDNSALNPISSDTQEAKNQLQSTILQFTQQLPSTCEEQEQAYLRLSQATTVSLTQTQPPFSSPIFSRRPNHEVPAIDATSEDYQGLSLIPNSPSHHLSSNLSISPVLPGLPLSTQREMTRRTFIRGTQELPLVPFSLTSSQILTRSQMLPESLMNDSVPTPPLLIEDSDFEE